MYLFIDLKELLPWWPTEAHSPIKPGILPGNRHNRGALRQLHSGVSNGLSVFMSL